MEPLMTLSEVSLKLNIGPHTLREWIKSGRLRALRLGPRGHWRVRWSDVLAVLEPAPAAAAKVGRDAS
jgi:excisionase family DNA binding protein